MRLVRTGTAFAAALAVAALVAGTPRSVDARDQDELRRDEVRRAVEAREIRPLADILNALRGKLSGEVAGVEIERNNGRWLYELRVIDRRGRLLEVYVDARSGEIERTKEK